MQNTTGYNLGKTYGAAWALGHTNVSDLEVRRACNAAAAPLYVNEEQKKNFERGWMDAVKRPASR